MVIACYAFGGLSALILHTLLPNITECAVTCGMNVVCSVVVYFLPLGENVSRYTRKLLSRNKFKFLQ